MRSYDEPALIRRLAALPPPLILRFAASCAERLIPAYEAFHKRSGQGDWKTLRRALNKLWACMDEPTDREWTKRVVAEVEPLARAEYEGTGDGHLISALAESAACAVCYALRCRLTLDPQEAAWSARMGVDALFKFVCETCGPIPTSNGPASVRWADANPLMQAEFERLERDLRELESAVPASMPTLVERMRARAETESGAMFGTHSTRDQ